jgi:hypothetical protein
LPIEFNLAELHPTFERPVIDTLRGLDADYPLGALSRVSLFSREGDLSMASADQPGEVKLNLYWFGKSIDVLRAAARERNQIYIGPDRIPLAWHGDMEEPHHVLAHEFGHCLQDVIPEWRAFSETHWLQSCRDPVNCLPVSGYTLVGPDEWWADTFAALRLNVSCEAVRLMRDMLGSAVRGRLG